MKMNLQLFGYDDGFYYGQCKLICETETVSGNGKTVTISGNGRTWSGTVADKLCSFLVPGRGQYTLSLMNGGTTLWSGTVEAGYGECIHVMLADGYEAVMEKSKLTLAEIEASVGSVADYVPDADCVKTLNNNLTANSVPFRFGYDSESGKYGYILTEGGADTVIPFNRIDEDYIVEIANATNYSAKTGTLSATNPYGSGIVSNTVQFTIDEDCVGYVSCGTFNFNPTWGFYQGTRGWSVSSSIKGTLISNIGYGMSTYGEGGQGIPGGTSQKYYFKAGEIITFSCTAPAHEDGGVVPMVISGNYALYTHPFTR